MVQVLFKKNYLPTFIDINTGIQSSIAEPEPQLSFGSVGAEIRGHLCNGDSGWIF